MDRTAKLDFARITLSMRPSTLEHTNLQRTRVELEVVLLTLLLALSATCRAADTTSVSGVVKDTHGVPQMGALVQLLADGSDVIGRSFTDLHGRYLISGVRSGRYQVRATANLYVPASRYDLRVQAGKRAIADLRLVGLFDLSAWFPAETRKAEEPRDDWDWTLRSAASRPILRFSSNDQSPSRSRESTRTSYIRPKMRAVVSGGSGFGTDGIGPEILAITPLRSKGSDLLADAAIRPNRSSGTISTRLTAGLHQASMQGQSKRLLVVTYQSHPEMVGTPGRGGIQTAGVSTAETMQLGEFGNLEAGTTLLAVTSHGTTTATYPFVRVSIEPSHRWSIGYRIATSRDRQSADDLDTGALPFAGESRDAIRLEKGLRQEVSAMHHSDSLIVRVAYVHDDLQRIAISGGGISQPTAVAAMVGDDPYLIDSGNGMFRFLTQGYSSGGWNVSLSKAILPGSWVTLEYAGGTGLSQENSGSWSHGMPLSRRKSQSVVVAAKLIIPTSGTRLKAAYRWQPENLVTAVDPYGTWRNQPFLGVHLRQPVRCRGLLPPGSEFAVDITNLLAQGYRRSSADPGLPFLAEAPRSMQAGLAFNF